MIKNDLISNNILCQNEVSCSKFGHVQCHHCPKILCLEHLLIHNELNIIRTDELMNEINNLTEYLININPKLTFENARNKLYQWKKENLNQIKIIYEYYQNEINRLENDLNIRLNIFKENIQLKTSDLKCQLSKLKKDEEISEKQLEPIELNLNQLQQCLKSIQCELSIEMKEISYNNSINLQNIFIYNYKFLNNTKLQSYRKLTIENLKEFISSNDNESLLCLDQQKQLYFIDEIFQKHLLTLPEEISCNIVDMKWCSNAQVFLILFQRYLLSFNPKTRQFNEISILRYKNYPFHCITCLNDQSIYISYSTSGICIQLYKYSFDKNNNISINECIKQYDCLTDDKNEWISNMNTNSDSHIGLLIRKGSSIYRRFELRNKNLDLIQIIELENDFIEKFYPLKNSYWFMKSLSGKYLIYSTEINEYSLSNFDFPFGIQEIGMNAIVIGNKQGELIYRDL